MDLLTAMCTCGHAASSHNALGVCFAPKTLDPHPGVTADANWCPCPDFTSPAQETDTAIAQATGVLVTGSNLQTIRDAITALKLRTPVDELAVDRLVMTLQDHEHETCAAADPSQCTGLRVARDVLAGRR